MTPDTFVDFEDDPRPDAQAFRWPRHFTVRSPCDSLGLAQEAGMTLAAGSPPIAFALVDRLCRMIVPSARDLLLRAQSHRAAGRIDAAMRDLSAAMAQDPTDRIIDRAALAWGDDDSRQEAARRVVAVASGDFATRRKAVETLLTGGARIVQCLQRDESAITGWLTWPTRQNLQIALRGGDDPQSFDIESDLQHPLASSGQAAAEIRIETSETSVDILVDGEVVESVTPVQTARQRIRAKAPQSQKSADLAETSAIIIVPVFEDFAATRECLEALEKARPAFPHRIIVVDDASPNPLLKAFLDAAAARGAFELIRNKTNLGFAASVNAALASRTSGDALLLNADVVLPPGAIDRLHALSRAEADIGTITPLTNNGELASYPAPNASNPLLAPDDVIERDALARAANGDALVDLPNGVGFCLYITQACLEAIGKLPEIYAQGYYEDVEYCLAARERGFRNVAAAGVYVGHAGSKSFGARKRALVMRNLEIIESRFPGYQLETAAFVALDPLRSYRAALDALTPPRGPAVIIACGPDAAPALGRRRADRVQAERPGVTALRLSAETGGRAVSLIAADGGSPQTLRFDLSGAESRDAFAAYFAKLEIIQIELLDPAGLPEPALSALLAAKAEVAVYCGDLGWFLPRIEASNGPCRALDSAQPCDACRVAAATVRHEASDASARRTKLSRALERADRIVPLDRLAETFARRVFRARADAVETHRSEHPRQAGFRPSKREILRLGALCPRPSASVDRLLLRLARRLAALNAPGSLVVFGATIDDEALMATQKAFVTGPAAADEYQEMSLHYGIDALFSPDRGGGFGDLDGTASTLGLAKGYFDWSFGAFPVERGDLSLDPRICDEKAAVRILDWMSGAGGGEE